MGFNKWIQHFSRRQFVRNVAIMMTGTAAAQLLAVLFSPLITRLYGPEAFGLFGTFIAFVTVFSPIAAFAFPIAIVLPEKDEDAFDIVILSFLLSILTTIIFTIFIVYGDIFLVNLFKLDELQKLLWLMPIAMLLSAWLQIAQQWFIRKKYFKSIAKITVIHSLIINTSKIGIGWFYPFAGILILLTVFGYLIHIILHFFDIRNAQLKEIIKSKKLHSVEFISVAKKYYDFPLYRAPQIFINTISHSLPILLLASFSGAMAAGFYVIARTVLGMPAQLIGKAVGDVFYSRITDAMFKNQSLTSLIKKATLGLICIGILPFGIIVVYGPTLFGFIFGNEWSYAGEYARWLSLMYFFNFINRPCIAAIPALGLQRELVIYEILSTISKFLALFTGFMIFQKDLIAIALFSLAGVLSYGLLIIWIIALASKIDQRNTNEFKAS